MGQGGLPSKISQHQAQSDLDVFQQHSDEAGKQVVIQKLQTLYGDKLMGDSLERFATILSNKEKLKEVYLHTDFEKAKELHRSIRDLNLTKPTELQKATMKYSSVSASPLIPSELMSSTPPSAGTSNGTMSTTTTRKSRSASTNSNSLLNATLIGEGDNINNNPSLNIEATEEEDEDTGSELDNVPVTNPYTQLDDNKIRIKLIVAETSKNAFEKNMKRMISPFVDMEKRKAPFGFFHIALSVGCWKIEWNNSSLCIPRTVTGNYSLICADIESIASVDELEFVRDKLAEIIVKWNTKVYYKQQNGNPDNGFGNCQQFIDDILQSLGIAESFSLFPPPLANYIKTLRENGYGEMEFSLSEGFKATFFTPNNPFAEKYAKKQSIIFHSHKELDEFAKYLFAIDTDFQLNYKYEYYLLKAYDRAFWMRHLKGGASGEDKDKEKYEPLEGDDGTLQCVFGDPTVNSFLAFNLGKKKN
ncbi:hypothetical protein ABK040_007287 [Willaertia magna]